MQYRNEDENKRRKTIAIQAAMEKAEESENKLSFNNTIQDEDLAMIVRKFRKFMGERRKRFSRRSIKKEEISRDKEKEKEKEKDHGPMCYECKKPGHMRYDCPSIKSSMRKKMKKALFRAWTDNKSSSSSSSEEEEHTNTANICLMAHEDDEV